jgi:hypothetical protein
LASLTIYDLQGHIVSQSTDSQVVNIQSLAKGVYVVRIQDKLGMTNNAKFLR